MINATLVGIIDTVRRVGAADRVYAGYPGISGVLDESIADITDIPADALRRLFHTPASGFIGTTRVNILDSHELVRLAAVFEAHGVASFVNIGGNGTVRQSMQISQHLGGGVRVIAAPKTVDNDLGDQAFERMLFTPGFPSCANYWRHKLWIMNQENLGACSHDKVLVAQTFGRKTGFLAGCARLGDRERRLPLILLLPEDQRPLENVLERIEKTVATHGRAIVVMSEGYDVGDIGERYDPTGQVMYGTSRTTAAQLLVNHCADIGIQARAFIPGFDQRSDITFVSASDLDAACSTGVNIVHRLAAGESDFLASIAPGDKTGRFEYNAIPFSDTSDYSRSMPAKWIAGGDFDVTGAYMNYVEPLIGQVPMRLPRRNGCLEFVSVSLPKIARRLPEWQAAREFTTRVHKLLSKKSEVAIQAAQ